MSPHYLQCCHILFPGAVSDRAGSVDHPAGVPGELLHHHGRPVAGGEEQVRLELLQGGMYQGDIPLLEGQSVILNTAKPKLKNLKKIFVLYIKGQETI